MARESPAGEVAVGILANPASGRDIRRLVARASVFHIAEKCNMIVRLLFALGSVGVERAYMMLDPDGIARRVQKDFAGQDSTTRVSRQSCGGWPSRHPSGSRVYGQPRGSGHRGTRR